MSAIRIMTGAPAPADADAVAPFEDVTETGRDFALTQPVRTGAHLRSIGSELALGDVAASAGSTVNWAVLALLTSLGIERVHVCRQPAIAVISTGDELNDTSPMPSRSMVPDSNGPMLSALIRACGALPRFLGIAGDSDAALQALLGSVSDADAIVVSGGVSAGDRDAVRSVLAANGAIAVSQVRMKPGRPFIFGAWNGTPVFALPGNPVAAAATFLQFVKPAIERMRGVGERVRDEAVASFRIENPVLRRLIVPVRLRRRSGTLPEADQLADGTSGMATYARADALMVIPETLRVVNTGDVVEIWRLHA
jgi:molybdenum cofactor synthesis domain-containing protein